MWTPVTRRQHSREGLRYQTDMTDGEWALIEPLMPKPLGRRRPRQWPLREVMNATFYVLRGGGCFRPICRLERRSIDGSSVAGYQSVRNHQSLACHGGPGAGWARGIAERCRARQPKRENDGERRAASGEADGGMGSAQDGRLFGPGQPFHARVGGWPSSPRRHARRRLGIWPTPGSASRRSGTAPQQRSQGVFSQTGS